MESLLICRMKKRSELSLTKSTAPFLCFHLVTGEWMVRDAYVYYFNEGNPWDGPWKNRASHILDLAYLFQNFREFLTPTQQAVGLAFAEDIFKFCHGISPWPVTGETTTGFTARTYGPSAQDRTAGQVTEPYGPAEHVEAYRIRLCRPSVPG